MPGLWRLGSQTEVLALVDDLNEHIDGYNQTTTWEPRTRLDREAVVAQWQQLRR